MQARAQQIAPPPAGLPPQAANGALAFQETNAPLAAVQGGTQPGKVEEKVEQALSSFFYRETKRRPVVTAVLLEA